MPEKQEVTNYVYNDITYEVTRIFEQSNKLIEDAIISFIKEKILNKEIENGG